VREIENLKCALDDALFGRKIKRLSNYKHQLDMNFYFTLAPFALEKKNMREES
jgi:hypothetical protein